MWDLAVSDTGTAAAPQRQLCRFTLAQNRTSTLTTSTTKTTLDCTIYAATQALERLHVHRLGTSGCALMPTRHLCSIKDAHH